MKSQIEATPKSFLNRDEQNTIVAIKYGGNAMVNEDIKKGVIDDVCQLKNHGYQPVIIHGGGPVIQETLDTAGEKSTFIDGHRQTTDRAMKYVEMALRGQVNGDLVRLINHNGCKAVGLSGKDAAMVRVQKRRHYVWENNQHNEVDLGQVGDVKEIDPTLLHLLMAHDYIPVIAPIGFCEDGKDYNVNADMFAGHLAGALNALSYIVLTNVDGLLTDLNNPDSVLRTVSIEELSKYMGNSIQGGMIPKVESCQIAVEQGVKSARIVNGTTPHSIINALLPEQPTGTQITN